MPRKLKTFITQMGFYDLAVAAPSMKAALDAWGASQNLFHQGFAHQTDDPAIVAAASAKPGTILRRAAGTKNPFTERAALPHVKGRAAKRAAKKPVPDLAAIREAKENRDRAQVRHARNMEKLRQRQAAIEDEIATEEARWEDERRDLDDAVRDAKR